MPAAPSATPPPAPSATPSPAPEPTPAPPPPAQQAGEKSPADYMADIEADLGQLDSPPAQPKPDAKVKGKGVAAPAAPKEPAPVDKPTEPAPPAEPPKPVRAAELRTAYETLKKEANDVLRPTIQRLESKIKELESRPAPDAKPMAEKLAAIEKRNQELEERIKFVDFTKSAEFREKHERPFNEAWARAVQDFSQLHVKVADGEDDLGEPKFSVRQASADDLLMLANLPLSEMDSKATELFGASAPRVIRHVEKIRELWSSKQAALENATKLASQADVERTEQRNRTLAMWNEENKSLATKYPGMFAPDSTDPDGNKLLEKGFAQADRLFAPTAETQPKTAEEAVRLHALIRHKAANHDRLVLRLKRMKAELEEARKSLEEYEKSEPLAGKGGEGGRSASKDPMQVIEDELRAMDR